MNKKKLKPFIESSGTLKTINQFDFIAPNHFAFDMKVEKNEDVIGAFSVKVFDCAFPIQGGGPMLVIDHTEMVSAFTLVCPGATPVLISKAFDSVKRLSSPRWEIWHRDHNVADEVHLADPEGYCTELLEELKKNLTVIDPPVNHNKISSKPEDRLGCDHIHLDSFEGMRRNPQGGRQAIDRYFINLLSKEREFLVSPINPNVVDALVPIDYNSQLLQDLFIAADFDIPMLKFKMPACRTDEGIFFGYKVRATYALHSEYGSKNDLLAIVNTLPSSI
jgi:hypothetical protein